MFSRVPIRMPRRSFLLGMGATALTSCVTTQNANVPQEFRVDLAPSLRNEIVGEVRNAPPLQIIHGERIDYDAHLRNRPTVVPGLDFESVATRTEVVPSADGIATWVTSNDPKGSGVVIQLMHPLGYESNYAHLQFANHRYLDFAGRRKQIGPMGSTGPLARGIKHLHLSLLAPAYFRFLTGVKTRQLSDGYVALDPEEFSVTGRGKLLPYGQLDDRTFDRRAMDAHREAEKFVEPLLLMIPQPGVSGLPETMVGSKRLLALQTAVIRPVDYEIELIYSAIVFNRYPGLFPKNDEAAIVAKLQEFMRQVPRLTAPIMPA